MAQSEVKFALPLDEIRAYCATQPIYKLSLFGSMLRGEATPESDVDLLVEFQAGGKITYFDLYYIQTALQSIIGREVDLLTPDAISQYFRDDVMAQAEVIYEQSRTAIT